MIQTETLHYWLSEAHRLENRRKVIIYEYLSYVRKPYQGIMRSIMRIPRGIVVIPRETDLEYSTKLIKYFIRELKAMKCYNKSNDDLRIHLKAKFEPILLEFITILKEFPRFPRH